MNYLLRMKLLHLIIDRLFERRMGSLFTELLSVW